VRVNFTEEEDQNLIDGIKEFGLGKWANILKNNKEGFHPKRTGTNLKDRWRNIKKSLSSEQDVRARQQEVEERIAREKSEAIANQENERQEQRRDLEQIDRQRAPNAEREEEERLERSQTALRAADAAIANDNRLLAVGPDNGAVEPAKEVADVIPPIAEGNLLPDANLGGNIVAQENVIAPERNETVQIPNPVREAENTPPKKRGPKPKRNMDVEVNAAEGNRATEVQVVEAIVAENNAGEENVAERTITTQAPDRSEAQIPVQTAANTPGRYPKRTGATPFKPQQAKKPKKKSAEVNRKVKQIQKAAKKNESEEKKPTKKATSPKPKKVTEPVPKAVEPTKK
jgi:hypothetical protein